MVNFPPVTSLRLVQDIGAHLGSKYMAHGCRVKYVVDYMHHLQICELCGLP